MAQKLLHYDVLEKLGEGARSIIYKVSDPETRQDYALKHVVRTDQKDIRFVEQMETEFEISRQFTHPNLNYYILETSLLSPPEPRMTTEIHTFASPAAAAHAGRLRQQAAHNSGGGVAPVGSSSSAGRIGWGRTIGWSAGQAGSGSREVPRLAVVVWPSRRLTSC